MMKKRFTDLEIGSVFKFMSEEDFPYSGIAKGPWVKVSPRTYHHVNDDRKVRHTVGFDKTQVLEIYNG